MKNIVKETRGFETGTWGARSDPGAWALWDKGSLHYCLRKGDVKRSQE